AAEAFGADRTFFLVNGSTCGIQAAIAAICGSGGVGGEVGEGVRGGEGACRGVRVRVRMHHTLVLGRDSHRAAFGAMMLTGVRPHYVMPEIPAACMDFGITGAVTPEKVREALENLTGEKDGGEVLSTDAVFITSPNYYGVCADVAGIAEVVHSYGRPLIVDEAHGAHLKFHEALPPCAMDQGADISIQSAHKTLPALTQASYLHMRRSTEYDDMESNIGEKLSLLETSSPSYLLMASLDYARAYMVNRGRLELGRLLDIIGDFREKITEVGPYRVLDGQGIIHDPTRLVIKVSGTGMTGLQVAEMLSSDYGIQVEMSDSGNIVCITTVADTREDFERLRAALKSIAERAQKTQRAHGAQGAQGAQRAQTIETARTAQKAQKAGERGVIKSGTKSGTKSDSNFMATGTDETGNLTELSARPRQIIEMSRAWAIGKKEIRLDEAAGSVSGELIVPYPPGIPLIAPGEFIFPETVKYLYDIIKAGAKVQGLRNVRASAVNVAKTPDKGSEPLISGTVSAADAAEAAETVTGATEPVISVVEIMGRIFCIVGKSGTGKNTVFDKLINDERLGLTPVVPYTTRPPRDGEIAGIHYNFISEDKLRKYEKAGRIIEKRRYDTVRGIWYYCTVDDGSIDLSCGSYLMIATVEAYTALKKYFGAGLVVPVYIDIDDETRRRRAEAREMEQNRPSFAEMERRLKADDLDFSPDKIEKAGINKIFYNYELKKCVEEIKTYILSFPGIE
ncbi:MAG: hypothetical protein PHG48_07250, partial [Eubacteriales bacterium]|nr:hypothetical protein [Eubacteriales bacterium]